MKTLTKIASLSLVLASVACGGALPPPQELVDARTAYKQASEGPAAQETPAQLHDAKTALDAAEAKFADDPGGARTKDLAYIAIRRAQYAESVARTSKTERDLAEAQKLAASNKDSELSSLRNQLGKEQAARADAEKRAAQAKADLAKIAEVKTESRGMVITLSGGVLFKTGKAELAPAALVQLNQVADALTSNSPDSTILVEGHTDDQGKADKNLELSQARAQSVVDYLVTRGVAKDRITAKGIGQERPIADNKSTEGRAQNRRVEIIVK